MRIRPEKIIGILFTVHSGMQPPERPVEKRSLRDPMRKKPDSERT
jgi:hypothetical protein